MTRAQPGTLHVHWWTKGPRCQVVRCIHQLLSNCVVGICYSWQGLKSHIRCSFPSFVLATCMHAKKAAASLDPYEEMSSTCYAVNEDRYDNADSSIVCVCQRSWLKTMSLDGHGVGGRDGEGGGVNIPCCSSHKVVTAKSLACFRSNDSRTTHSPKSSS
jgi:hypothetical protein